MGSFTITCCVILFSAIVGTMAAPQEATTAVAQKKLSDVASSIVSGTNLAGVEAYKVLSATPGNVVYSPISTHAVFALAYLGARGNTAAEFSKSLHLPVNQADVSAGYGEILPHLKREKADSVKLDIVNKLYPASDIQLAAEFKNQAIAGFQSTIENLNFTNNVESAATINTFIEEKTAGKIKDVITADDVDSSTKLVLVNTVYLKAKWQEQFSSQKDYLMTFHIDKDTDKQVPKIFREGYFNYAENAVLDAKILEVPYADEDLAFYVVVPNEIDGLKNIEEQLPVALEAANSLENHYVDVDLPKFKVEFKVDLKEVMTKLGVSEAFSNGADFSGLTENAIPLKIDKATQKVFIAVDEDGTEAAAASVLLVSLTSLHYDQKYFHADRPFLYFIKEKRSGSLLFMGRVADPSI